MSSESNSRLDKMERTIEFILEQQAKAEIEAQELRQAITGLIKHSESTDKHLTELAEQAELDRQYLRDVVTEMRDSVNKLMDSIENTRDCSQQVARLAVSSEKRLSNLENKVDTLDSSEH